MTLRPAAPEDAPALAAVHAEGFDQPWSAGDIAALLEGPGGFGLLVEQDGAAVGFVLARAIAGEAEILTVAVAPERRGRGIGAALMEAAVRTATAQGATAMFLEVAVDNTAALALYERAGFRRAGFRPGYYRREGGAADALVLRRDLG
ncbi:MAG TPA: ribosomal protein S18-alanine N-acetyltransferase [Caulobacteraceae bacterium]|nr:ribosomal protein S18-alanine N-acetyltransferase [Caulobacteraceae bacterium]